MTPTEPLTPLQDARRRVLESLRRTDAEVVDLDDALGRVLASDIRSDVDHPPFDRAMMDGFAIRSADASTADVTLQVVGQLPAGTVSTRELRPGEAMQINTGAPLPDGADAVVPVELTEADKDSVTIRTASRAGQHIARRATHVSAGQSVLSAGAIMDPWRIAVAAASGAGKIPVYKRPTVAVLVTGDELVGVNDLPQAGQIRDSNGPMLAALVRRCGIEPRMLGVAGDDRELLTQKIREGLDCDCLCISGGISMGAFDFVPSVLAECGVDIRVRKIAIKPGKPTLFGVSESGSAVFGLPGNPVSGLVAFQLLVAPATRAMQGVPDPVPLEWTVRLIGELAETKDRQSYYPARLGRDDANLVTADPLKWAGSGDPFGLAAADVMIVRQPGQPPAKTGDDVRVILL